MELIDEVDYHCCIFCDKIFPSDYELLMHVSEIHPTIIELNSKPKDDSMEYSIQSIVNDEESIQCDEYLESILTLRKSPILKVNLFICINLFKYLFTILTNKLKFSYRVVAMK